MFDEALISEHFILNHVNYIKIFHRHLMAEILSIWCKTSIIQSIQIYNLTLKILYDLIHLFYFTFFYFCFQDGIYISEEINKLIY